MRKIIFILASLLLTVSVFGQWSLTGNTGTDPSTNFIGTTDNQTLVFRVNNNHSGYIQTFSNASLGYMSFGYSSVTSLEVNNTAFGSYSLGSNTNVSSNSSFGSSALNSNTTGSYNVAVGNSALRSTTIGTDNVAVGSGAAVNNQTVSGLTIIGSGSNAVNLMNATAIGMSANATANNQVRIGNTNVTSIGGQVAWTSLSDGRIKKNIKPNVPGLEFINKLHPITYMMDLDAIEKITDVPKRDDIDPSMAIINKEAKEAKEKIVYTGFIAQEVEKAAQDVGFDFSGVDAPTNDKTLYGLRYAEFVVPLVKSVQEMSEQLQNQVEQNALLKNQVDDLTKLVNMSGQELRKFKISGAGAGSITISAGSLSAGMYYYSLYVDNVLIDIKRMIIT